MVTRRIALVVVWALSLVAVANWGARAQNTPPPSGSDVRFVYKEMQNGVAVGELWAQVEGKWVRAQIQGVGGLVPVR
jgi:hypothetical protein